TDNILDVGRPLLVVVDGIDRQADDLDAAFVEFRFQSRHCAEFGGANRGEILWMRKQYRPIVADPVVEANFAFRGLGLKIWGGIINLKCHRNLPLRSSGVLASWPYVRRSGRECQPCSRSFASGHYLLVRNADIAIMCC